MVEAGWFLSVVNIVALGSALVVPILATRAHQQVTLGVGTTTITGLGLFGFTVWSEGAIVWALLLGTGAGASFGLALTLFVLRSRDARHAAVLSGMAQSVGYLVAAVGPVLIGLLHDLTGAWSIPLLALTLFLLPQAIFAAVAGRPRQLG